MKLEIELDLNKIDYDAINQQIQQKIADLDLTTTYQINTCIKKEIDNQVSDIVKHNMYKNYWGNSLDEKMDNAITTEFRNLLKETIDPIIKDAFNKIPEEEIVEMFLRVFPLIYMSAMTDAIKNNFYSDRGNTEALIHNMIVDRLQHYVHI